jgi:hypothetical protein
MNQQHAAKRVLLAHKLFGASRGLSHIGLGIAAISTQKVLRASGIQANIQALNTSHQLATNLATNPHDAVIISAPWIPTIELATIAHNHPETKFAVCCHSNVGFPTSFASS